MKRISLFATVLLIASLALAACSAPVAQTVSAGALPAPTATVNAPAAVTAPITNGSLAGIESTLENIYQQVNPSVVAIQVLQQQTSVGQGFPSLPGLPFFGGPQSQAPQQQFQSALGSGFVWDKQGDIVTNNHVVDGATKISVVFSDGTTVPGKVIGTDVNSDLAVVKVDVPADKLQPVAVADSTQVKVGQLSIAIGNPFGEQNTMTVGFVSALGRSLPVNNNGSVAQQGPSYTIPDVIQTDTPINPGNSGGVLVNDQGQVIGVTSAIESPVRASSGIGFAIPAQIVQQVVPALIKSGHYDHAWLGISGTSLDPDLAQAMNLNADQRGALVLGVTPNSPADKAGLQGSNQTATINGQQTQVGGDVIIAIDNQPVKTFDDLVAYLATSTQVNQTVTLTVLRNGQQQSIKVTLAARPDSNAPQANSNSTTSNGTAWLGIAGLDMSPAIATAMNLPSAQQGVLIEQVESGSPAEKAGLQGSPTALTVQGQQISIGGDVIVMLDGQPISGISDLQSVLQQDRVGQTVTLTIVRNGRQQHVTVTLGQRPSIVQ